LLDRAIRDYRHATADQRRQQSTALYAPEERWDMVIKARHVLEEIEPLL
jgi:hypothetical protein